MANFFHIHDFLKFLDMEFLEQSLHSFKTSDIYHLISVEFLLQSSKVHSAKYLYQISVTMPARVRCSNFDHCNCIC